MVRRNFLVIILFCVLLAGVLLEQNYIDASFSYMDTEVKSLEQEIQNEDLDECESEIEKIKNYWSGRELLLSLFVDYKDIDQIGKQITLISAHLSNNDFELAFVECKLLAHITKTYHNTVNFDWQNII